jgi:hypothetical protein
MAKELMVKKLGALYPADEKAEVLLRRLKLGEVVTVEIHQPRNIHFHRKLMAMLRIIFDNQETYKSVDDLLELCKLRTGHCHTVETKYGEVKITDSISFASMDNVEFADFYDRACNWVVIEVIPGLDLNDLNEEVRNQLQEFGTPEG